jgi:uncharacterized membrane protein YqjE
MRRTVIIAIILFGLDAVVFNQGFIAFITLFIALPIMFVRALIRWKDKPLLKKRLTACGIYLFMSILILASIGINNKIARSRAEVLIVACEKYKDTNKKYPERLSDLVPDFIREIPVAKYTLGSNRFYYIASEESHLLLYTAMPPFGKPTYNFEKREWSYTD